MSNNKTFTTMKKIMIALVAMLTMSVSTHAMSYEQARNEALFLTDKMAYELNLTDEQYEAAYEINLDYLMGVTSVDDVYGPYWERRNLDLSYILMEAQWNAFIAASYFYRPLYWDAGYWHFGIYARYPHRDYFYFGRPHFYATYRGGHAWHRIGGHGYYYGRRDHYRPAGGHHVGMRDGWHNGDYRIGRHHSSTVHNGGRHGNGTYNGGRHGNGGSIGNGGHHGNGTLNGGRHGNGTMNGRHGNGGGRIGGTTTTPRNNDTHHGGRVGTTPNTGGRTGNGGTIHNGGTRPGSTHSGGTGNIGGSRHSGSIGGGSHGGGSHGGGSHSGGSGHFGGGSHGGGSHGGGSHGGGGGHFGGRR